MILYTAVPLEQVFEGIDDIQAPEEIVVGDMTMQVERVSATEARVIRLISPRPDDYLNEAYAPGAIIRFSI